MLVPAMSILWKNWNIVTRYLQQIPLDWHLYGYQYLRGQLDDCLSLPRYPCQDFAIAMGNLTANLLTISESMMIDSQPHVHSRECAISRLHHGDASLLAFSLIH